MKVAAGIITWEDHPALDNAIASVRGHVDEVIVVDGLIDGVLPERKGEWRSQAAKRTATLMEARNRGCDWLLVIDADEQLHRGELLGLLLDTDAPAVALPTDDGLVSSVRLLRTSYWRCYLVGAHTLQAFDGRVYQLPRHQLTEKPSIEPVGPWIEHRPDLRPSWRQQFRLGALAEELEPNDFGKTIPTLAL